MAGNTAVVTGGSVGIGRSICEEFVNAGYQVINLARRPYTGDAEVIDKIVDLADQSATRSLARQIAREYEVTTFVHNAGVIRPALLEEVEIQDISYLENLHLHAPILLQQAFLPAMRAAQFGRVILISSRAAVGLQSRTAYSATKAGMLGMARTWALELAAAGITVNVVAPGPIAATEMFHAVIPDGSEKMQTLAASIPVRRLGQPQDVSRAVMFFADPANSFITGQTLYVCGGTSVGSLTL